MKRILITGANGFVGSFLVEEALKRKHKIYAAVRKTSNLEFLADKRIHIIYIDLSDKQKLMKAWAELKLRFSRFDHIIHCAGATTAKHPDDFDLVNNKYTQNLYESLVEANFKPLNFALISSLAVNGPGNPRTLSPVKLSDTPNPITAYGKSKLAAEKFLRNSNEIPYLIFRPTGIYGPRDKGYLTFFKAINQHLIPYPESSKQLLSFIYVQDLAGIIFLAINSGIYNKTYIVSDGENYTCKEFAEIGKEALKKWAIPIYFPKLLVKIVSTVSEIWAARKNQLSLLNRDKFNELTSRNWSCSSWELQADFNFSPRFPLQKGVENTISWYKKNKWL